MSNETKTAGDQDLARQLASLSPEKRALLFEKLQKEKEKSGRKTSRDIQVQARDKAEYPLSFAQQRLWFLQQYEPENPEYNVPQGYRLLGDLKPELMMEALDLLLARHESLRTIFREVDEQPVQVIQPLTEDGRVTASAVLPLVDLRTRPSERREADALDEMTVDAQKPFDLTRGPLMNCRLFRLEDEEYLLFINVHHITFDGWSHGVLIGELLSIYEALVAGEENPLPPMPVQYLDFAVWQREWLQGKVLQRQIDFWTEKLQAVPALEIHTDRPRPSLRSYNGTTWPVSFTAEQSEKLRRLSKEEDCTLFITLLAAFRTLLYRYTAQSDIAVGTLIANRTRPELEGIIGFFANTLALRTDVSDEPTFRQLMVRERDGSLDAYSHQDLPFEKLVEELNPERDLSRTPFIQVMFILQNMPTARKEGSGSIELTPLGVDSRTAKFDFTLYLTDGPELSGFLEYNTDVYDRETVARLMRHFNALVDGVVEDPDRTLEAYPLMESEERDLLLVEWNNTAAPYPSQLCLHQLFEKQVRSVPDDPALVYENQTLSYGELNQRANALAWFLMDLGVGPGSFVGVCTDRSPVMVSGLLAVLKTGAAYLPMDPDYPEDRLAFMLEDTRAPVLLTQKALLEKLPKHNARMVLLDNALPGFQAPGSWEAKATENPPCRSHPEGLAYVIHTSGSTGKPKGVVVSHGAVVNFLASMAKRPGISAEDTLLAVTTLSFDIAGLELYLPLSSGAKLVVASRDTASDGEGLIALMKSSGASIMQATPATWRLLLDAGWTGDGGLKVLCGGEALPRDLADKLLTKSSSLWNVYGPTEATIWSTVRRVESGDGASGTVTIGTPMHNYSVYLLDAKLNPVPVGVPGELHIGGSGLARGYLNRPDLTARQFIPDPFASMAGKGARLYKTGDLAAWSADGNIAFMGRIDHQVKVRGYRIELGEIETQLNLHPHIGQAVVIVREDKPGDKRLVAYLTRGVDAATGKKHEIPGVSELREFLKEKLPDYMVPALFIPLDKLPLTPNGKVNRKGLPKPDPSQLRSSKEYVAPRDETETQMAAIWTDVLGVEKIGINDDFFELGGDSLMVIRVVSKAKKADLSITTKQVFQHKTIAELCAVVGATIILAEQGPVVGPVTMTPSQTHFLELGHTQPHLHSLGAFLTPKDGRYHRPSLEGALRKILEHHDTLRMRLDNLQAPWSQVGEPLSETLPLEYVELADLDLEGQGDAFDEHARDFLASFQLDRAPLFKAVLYDYGDKQPPMLWLMGHFLVADIGSWQTILDDFDGVYRQLSRGEVLEIQDKTTSFRQWVDRLTERANSSDMDEERKYWLMEERKDTARMPLDFPDGENVMRSSKSVSIQFSVEETQCFLKDIPRTTGAQIDAILLTAVLYAFEYWTGSRSLLIDLLGHGREPLFDDVDLTRTVGWLNTIYPAYLTLGDAETPVAAMKSVNDQLRAIPNGGIGYGILRYLNRDPKIIEHFKTLPEPQVFFNYFGDDHASELSVLTKEDGFGGYGFDNETHRLRPLAVGIYIKEGKLLFRWEHSTNIHRHETIEKVAEQAQAVLKRILAEYDRD